MLGYATGPASQGRPLYTCGAIDVATTATSPFSFSSPLYGFMAFHPGDTVKDRFAREAGPVFPVRPHLFVALHCDDPRCGAARCALDGVDEVRIGRGPHRAVSTVEGTPSRLELALPDCHVSSAHARLISTDEGWIVEDAGSTNGTFVNGRRIRSARVDGGDVIEVGHTFLILHPALPTTPDTAVWAELEAAISTEGSPRTLLPFFARTLARLQQVACSTVPVWIWGETGTGKEIIARSIHETSGRSGALVSVNCGALSPMLIDSQLFGHVRGAFTGAVRDHLGFVRAADRGTLFLDEIGDLPPPAQAAFLRAVQEREVVPVGSTRPVAVDLRFIAATRRRVEQHSDGVFRRDLLARLTGFVVEAPDVVARRCELGAIVSAILRRAGAPLDVTIDPSAARLLFAYSWPHNIRELEQCLRTALALSPTARIAIDHLPEVVARAAEPSDFAPDRGEPEPTDALRAELVRLLRAHDGKVVDVARELGKARTQVYRWLTRFDIDPAAYRRTT